MATTESTEWAFDSSGLTIKTEVKKDFVDIAPSSELRGWRKTYADGVYAITEESYEGSGTPVYSVEVGMSQEPLETHPKFTGASATELGYYQLYVKNSRDPALPSGWKPSTSTDTKVQKLWEYRLIGITDYLCPKIVVKMSTLEDDAPVLANIGLVDDPGITVGPSGRTFVLTGASGQQEGSTGKWRNTYEWTGSGTGGWDTYLYTA